MTGITFSTDFPLRMAFQPTRHGGVDAFVTRFKTNGEPVFSTYLGGDGIEWGYDVACGSTGESFVVGFTDLDELPRHRRRLPDHQRRWRISDVIRRQAREDGALAYGTYVGGTDGEEALGVAVGATATPT